MISRMSRAGTLLVLASAAAFGSMGIFGKLAYEEGANAGTVLAARFVVASALLWAFVLVTGRLGALRAVGRRDLWIALALGAVGYSAQATTYFLALDRLDASVLTLLLYTFPAMVSIGAIALGRDTASWQTGAGIALSFGGTALVALGGGSGPLDAVGVALGLTAAVVYSVYILSSEGVAERMSPLALTTYVCSGAAFTMVIGTTLTGSVDLAAVSAEGLGWIAAIALVSTIAAITLFFAGLPLVGPTAASILSTFEPVVAVTLAWLVLDEPLGIAKILGGALVLGAVLVIRSRPAATPEGQIVAQEVAAP